MSIPNNNYQDWLATAQKFSEADLQAHPITAEVMQYFSDDATFDTGGWFNYPKPIARIGFKILCENDCQELKLTEPPKFEDKGDHINWSFKSIQKRGLLHESIKTPTEYEIEGEYELYFDEANLISRMVTIRNNWTPTQG